MLKLRAVLAEISQDVRDGKPHHFAISYVKADGSLGSKARVRKSGTAEEKVGGSRFKYRIKEKGVLLLHDTLTDKPFAIKISRITHYNGREVWH